MSVPCMAIVRFVKLDNYIIKEIRNNVILENNNYHSCWDNKLYM